jgi:hypothetical protein
MNEAKCAKIRAAFAKVDRNMIWCILEMIESVLFGVSNEQNLSENDRSPDNQQKLKSYHKLMR